MKSASDIKKKILEDLAREKALHAPELSEEPFDKVALAYEALANTDVTKEPIESTVGSIRCYMKSLLNTLEEDTLEKIRDAFSAANANIEDANAAISSPTTSSDAFLTNQCENEKVDDDGGDGGGRNEINVSELLLKNIKIHFENTLNTLEDKVCEKITDALCERVSADRYSLVTAKKKARNQLYVAREMGEMYRRSYDIASRFKMSEEVRVVEEQWESKFNTETDLLNDKIEHLEFRVRLISNKLVNSDDKCQSLESNLRDLRIEIDDLKKKLIASKNPRQKQVAAHSSRPQAAPSQHFEQRNTNITRINSSSNNSIGSVNNSAAVKEVPNVEEKTNLIQADESPEKSSDNKNVESKQENKIQDAKVDKPLSPTSNEEKEVPALYTIISTTNLSEDFNFIPNKMKSKLSGDESDEIESQTTIKSAVMESEASNVVIPIAEGTIKYDDETKNDIEDDHEKQEGVSALVGSEAVEAVDKARIGNEIVHPVGGNVEIAQNDVVITNDTEVKNDIDVIECEEPTTGPSIEIKLKESNKNNEESIPGNSSKVCKIEKSSISQELHRFNDLEERKQQDEALSLHVQEETERLANEKEDLTKQWDELDSRKAEFERYKNTMQLQQKQQQQRLLNEQEELRVEQREFIHEEGKRSISPTISIKSQDNDINSAAHTGIEGQQGSLDLLSEYGLSNDESGGIYGNGSHISFNPHVGNALTSSINKSEVGGNSNDDKMKLERMNTGLQGQLAQKELAYQELETRILSLEFQNTQLSDTMRSKSNEKEHMEKLHALQLLERGILLKELAKKVNDMNADAMKNKLRHQKQQNSVQNQVVVAGLNNNSGKNKSRTHSPVEIKQHVFEDKREDNVQKMLNASASAPIITDDYGLYMTSRGKDGGRAKDPNSFSSSNLPGVRNMNFLPDIKNSDIIENNLSSERTKELKSIRKEICGILSARYPEKLPSRKKNKQFLATAKEKHGKFQGREIEMKK